MSAMFGCRHPESCPGTWDRAMVAARYKGDDSYVVAVFIDGLDYIAHVNTLAEAKAVRNDFRARGWTHTMSDDDLCATAGVRKPSSPCCSSMLFAIAALAVAYTAYIAASNFA